MKSWLCLSFVGLTVALSSCGSDPPPPPATPATVERAHAAPPPPPEEKAPTQAALVISEDIARACGLSQTEAFFAFDSARVDGRAEKVLGKLVDCFVKGPLAGKSMRLVGHADPRGDEEYNLVLGGRRADNVRGVMVNLGMPGERVSSTSRGEMDASGQDEHTWAKDRRVDVLLGG